MNPEVVGVDVLGLGACFSELLHPKPQTLATTPNPALLQKLPMFPDWSFAGGLGGVVDKITRKSRASGFGLWPAGVSFRVQGARLPKIRETPDPQALKPTLPSKPEDR